MTGNVAILHNRWTGRGGGGRVTAELARVFDAPVYVGFVDESCVPDDVRVERLPQSGLDRLAYHLVHTGPLPGQDLYDAQRMSHWPRLADYDVVIVTQSDAAWYVPTDDQTLVRYVHAPVRWAYDRWQTRDANVVRRAYATLVRGLHSQHASYPDRYVANSELVAARTRRYLSRGSPVSTVYPPVETESYPDARSDGYVAYVGRLHPSKRVGLCIRAAAEADVALVVAGEGGERDRLERVADDCGADVTFHGYVSEDRKREVLAHADATLFAAVQEDFGIVPVESMAAGTPVVGVDEGFTRHQIHDGANGVLCPASPAWLAKGIRVVRRDGVSWPASEMREWGADHFGRERFARQMRAVVDDAISDARVETRLDAPEEVSPHA